mgnify:CR=1 FL=1
MKALFGLWSSFKVAQINRLLRPHNVRLVLKKSKDWGDQVSLTAHLIKEPLVVGPNLTATEVLAREKEALDRFPAPSLASPPDLA